MVRNLRDTICIAISGTHGAGTSTAAMNIARSLNLRLVSAGQIFRESARKQGIDIREFTRIAEGDSVLTEEVDEIIRDEAGTGNVVVEGRIACWTAGDLASLRVMIDAPLKTRVSRLAKRDDQTVSDAEQEILQREKEAQVWFLENAGFDLKDLSVYDLIINTERITSEYVTRIIQAAIVGTQSQPRNDVG